MILNKEIDVIKGPNEILSAVALDIDDDFHLKVRYANGEVEYLNSGEVSIKKSSNN